MHITCQSALFLGFAFTNRCRLESTATPSTSSHIISWNICRLRLPAALPLEVIFDCLSPLRHYSNHLCTTIVIITSYLTLQLPLAGRSVRAASRGFPPTPGSAGADQSPAERRSDLLRLVLEESLKGKAEWKPKRDGFLPRVMLMTARNRALLLPSTSKYSVNASQSLPESS